MNWLTAMTTGAGIGLAFFGGLWVTLRLVARFPHRRSLMAASGIVRFGLATAGFYALARFGTLTIPAALAGFWLARRWLISSWGGIEHAD